MKHFLSIIILFYLTIYSTFGQGNTFDEMVSYTKKLDYTATLSTTTGNDSSNTVVVISVNFPKNYFNKNATLSIIPVIKADEHTRELEPEIYIGKSADREGITTDHIIDYIIEREVRFTRKFKYDRILDNDFEIVIWTKIEMGDLTEKFVAKRKTIKKEEVKKNNGNDNNDNDNDKDTTKIKDTTKNNNKPPNNNKPDIKPDKVKKDSAAILLELIKNNRGNDKAVANLNEQLGDLYTVKGNYDKAAKAYHNALLYKDKINDNVGKGDIYTDLGKLKFKTNKNVQAIEYYKEAIKNYESEGENKRLELTYSNIGTIFSSMELHEEAIDAYDKALKKTKKNDNTSRAKYKSIIGDTYYKMNELKKSLKYYEEVIKHEKNNKNISELITSYNNAAIVYSKAGNIKKAHLYINKAIELSKNIDSQETKALLHNNKGNINFQAKNYEQALVNYNKSLELRTENDSTRGKAIALYNVGNINFLNNDKAEAEKYFKKSNGIAVTKGYKSIAGKNYFMLSEIVADNINCTEAFDLYKNYLSANSISFDDKKNPIAEFSDKYMTDRSKAELIDELSRKEIALREQTELAEKRKLENKLLEIENRVKEEANERQKTQITFLLIGIVLILIFAVFAAVQYYHKKKANNQLQLQNAQIIMQKDEIQTQRDELLSANKKITLINKEVEDKNKKITLINKEIETKNRKLTSSIYYAEHIQKALLPSNTYLQSVLNEYFVLYKPKDIVSGDFYWVADISSDETIIIAADCTGHGVPGAMMSMLGISLLNEIINSEGIVQVDEILNVLRKKIIDSLNPNKKRKEKITRDGMDLALLKINKKTMKLEFAGANNPLIIVRNKEVMNFKPDHMPIGAYLFENNFSKKEIELETGDMLYIFSDGYADQFGGRLKRKFFLKRLRMLLSEISKEPAKKQEQILADKFYKWKGKLKQIDDILIFGIRV